MSRWSTRTAPERAEPTKEQWVAPERKVEFRPVRLVDVAEHAGVSLATASRVLNSERPYGGRALLRERVLASAAELGYEPNPHARALASSTSTTIGLVVHDIRDAYFALIAGAVVSAAEEHGMFVTIVSTYRDPAQEVKYLKVLRAQRPRAIILAGSGFTNRTSHGPIQAELARFEETGGVVVTLGRQDVGHTISVGNEDGAYQLAHALVDLGHRDFAVATGPARLTTVRDRLAGFRRGLSERGIELDASAVLNGDATRDSGFQMATAIAGRTTLPTCVFGSFDVVAAGLVAGFRDAGIDVPGTISVAGFGDIPVATDITPALTSVSLPLELVGRQAVDLALSEEPNVRRTVSFAGEVVMRESTAPPRA
ncbi:LacI family DNA-binding transcriptional regulator [Georgenia wangjunii]|uniref:LacI family DNA-binding transcriptional regulator n=1 Tax=Georgenia wangjunii TaxID=3117730 RepID=UPI002F260BE9